MPTWRQQILAEIIDFCDARKSRSFTSQEFTDERLGVSQAFQPRNNIIPDTPKSAPELHDQGLLTFVNNKGLYTSRGHAHLEHDGSHRRHQFMGFARHAQLS